MLRCALVVALLAATVFAGAAPARLSEASWHPFLVHVNSDSNDPYNCGNDEWSSPGAVCDGRSAPSGHSYGFNLKQITVRWCAPHNGTVCPLTTGHTLPHGWTRWMVFCRLNAKFSCDNNWLLGAVHMPNGPFAIVAGKIDGQHVTPTSFDHTRIGKPGGPLGLFVSYKGRITPSDGVTRNGYTFGLVGEVHF